ncbi:MAG TPA: phospholipid carrier-dependent glycosyltransferase [Anaerolineales bacterium]|nr:phospholipid carrier-dependent glycosyltransferase [Anaerolineales bacterium]
MPGWYNYPSMIYDLTVLSVSPEIISTYVSDRSTFRDVMSQRLWGKEASEVFRPRARMLFLGITSLSLLWIYLLVYIWTKQWPQALLSSAILASSWEFAYHARWIAPDSILMQFGILTLLLVFIALHSYGRRRYIWLIAAAIAAGMACGTKYFGGLFLVPVFIGGYKLLRDAGAKWSSTLTLFLGLAAAFSLTFLIITPGALLDTGRMIEDIQFEINHYRSGDMGYTVHRGWEHLSLLFVYLFGVFFSNSIWLSALFSVFVPVGLYFLLKWNWKAVETWVFLSVPVLFIPYMSQQQVLMVRNYLLLFPFLAILCAKGLSAVWNSRPFQSSLVARTIFVAGLVSALLINYNWLHAAAQSIPASASTDRPQELRKYLLANRETPFYLSPEARGLIDSNEFTNVVHDPALAEKFIFVFKEVNFPLANRPNVYDPVFGPYEINLDYYPSWNEDGRIVVMPMKAALPQSQFGFMYE